MSGWREPERARLLGLGHIVEMRVRVDAEDLRDGTLVMSLHAPNNALPMWRWSVNEPMFDPRFGGSFIGRSWSGLCVSRHQALDELMAFAENNGYPAAQCELRVPTREVA